ncbi:MAG: RagB/SusD family nutrient uptake outer membrane protein [Bacteroidales bacterium]|nr:RagB/SusD family nutrient uptake outer membrane protein [Bacteroidales bacterium]
MYWGLMDAGLYTDLNSDIAFGTGADEVSDGSYLAPTTSTDWSTPWTYIQSCNYILSKAEDSGLDDSEIGRWKGEALFFRAYNYWKLMKEYGGVPKILTVLSTDSEELYSERVSQQEIAEQIIADLESAEPYLPSQKDMPFSDMGRVTKGAANALLARVALYEGTWEKYHGGDKSSAFLDKAISAASSVVDSKDYSVFTDMGTESYKHLFILGGDDCSEVILAKRYYKERLTHNWTRELWFNPMVPTKNIADMYLLTNGLPIDKDKSGLFKGYSTMTSEFDNRDPRMAMTFLVPGTLYFGEGSEWVVASAGFTGSTSTHTGYMLRKFRDETSDAAQFRCEYDFKEFRYGEVLLILAEALYEKNGSITDDELDKTINLLRARVSMPSLTNAFVNSNGLNMQEEIRRERTIELAFEGYRRDDLRRWGTADEELVNALRGVKFKDTEYQSTYPELKIGTDIIVDSEGFIVAEAASDRHFETPKHWYTPIPLKEVQLSKGTLKQNPGW